MIMEINLGSPQDASVGIPFHLSFHRCDDVAPCPYARCCWCVFKRRSFSRVPVLHTHARASLHSPCYSVFSPPTIPRLLFSRLLVLIFVPHACSARAPLPRRSSSVLPRSSNLPIACFRRIRPTVMDYRSAHGHFILPSANRNCNPRPFFARGYASMCVQYGRLSVR